MTPYRDYTIQRCYDTGRPAGRHAESDGTAGRQSACLVKECAVKKKNR